MTAVPSNSAFEIVTTTAGVVSIRDNDTREIMHNPVGPWAEANALYIEQSKMRERLTENLDKELVVFDVGLGAAANAIAALHCARSLQKRRPLKLISFEVNLELLRFALENAHHFDHFQGFEPAIAAILEHGVWREEGIEWHLRHGDFADLIEKEKEKANLVFFDPYSPKKNIDMWTEATFAKLNRACARGEEEGAVLFTYSRATPVRVAMFMGGFYVGTGLASGLKDETTQAATRFEDLANPLGKPWLGRWQRSHHPNALGASPAELPRVQEYILAHPQFQ